MKEMLKALIGSLVIIVGMFTISDSIAVFICDLFGFKRNSFTELILFIVSTCLVSSLILF